MNNEDMKLQINPEFENMIKGIHQNRGRRTQIRGFPISKQDKGVLIRTPITATGNAVREF